MQSGGHDGRLQVPGRIVVRQILGREPQPRLHRRAAGHALPTPLVVGTDAGHVEGQEHVTGLRMLKAADDLTAAHDTAADAGPDGHVHQIRVAKARPETHLAQSGGGHVSGQCHRNAEPGAQHPEQIHVDPATLGSRQNPAISGGVRIRVAGPEGAKPNAVDGVSREEFRDF